MQSLEVFMTPYYEKIRLHQPEKLKRKKILITGATGLIGSNIVSYLTYLNRKLKLQLEIMAIHQSSLEKWMSRDLSIRYCRTNLAKKNISKNLHFDFLIHCATYAQPKKFLAFPRETIHLNTTTLLDLLDSAKKNKASVLYLSSAEIYGQPDSIHIPTNETYFGNVNTLSERAIYAEAKRIAETICFAYSTFIPIKIARVLIGYGPGVKVDDQRVISEFIKKAHTKKIITMMDEGKAERTFCFITDTVEMLLNSFLSGKEIVYNIAGRETKTIKELAKKIATLNHVEFEEKGQEDKISGTPKKSVLDNRLYTKEFRKTKFVGLNEGLKITSEWFKNIK